MALVFSDFIFEQSAELTYVEIFALVFHVMQNNQDG